MSRVLLEKTQPDFLLKQYFFAKHKYLQQFSLKIVRKFTLYTFIVCDYFGFLVNVI